jgi:VCBS repeat-containing protein
VIGSAIAFNLAPRLNSKRHHQGDLIMRSALIVAMTLLTLAGPVYAADNVASAVAGSVKKVDSATKTLVVKTNDGAEHTFHFTEKVSVHGAKDVAKTPKETLDSVKEGSRVAVHYTAIGGKDTAREADPRG